MCTTVVVIHRNPGHLSKVFHSTSFSSTFLHTAVRNTETCTPARLGARDIGGGRRPGESCERDHFIGAFGHEAKTGELILLATPVAVMTEAREALL